MIDLLNPFNNAKNKQSDNTVKCLRLFELCDEAATRGFRSIPPIVKKELSELDYDPKGFEWMSCMDADHSIVSFVRTAENGKMLLFVFNFTPVVYDTFVQAVPVSGKYTEILNSDDTAFGGQGHVNPKPIISQAIPKDGKENCIVMKLAPLSCTIFDVKPAHVKIVLDAVEPQDNKDNGRNLEIKSAYIRNTEKSKKKTKPGKTTSRKK